jgi:Protein of unknown function (DUF2937)
LADDAPRAARSSSVGRDPSLTDPFGRDAMYILRGLFDRFILLAAFLVAGCVPAFIAQYRQRLGGALDQVTKDLAPFREIAKQMHGGKLEKLIEHHQFSPDATFQAEGNAIQAMVRSLERLRGAAEAFDASLIHQVMALIQRGDPQIAKATWAAYEPAMSFSFEGLVFAGGVAVIVWLIFILGWLMFFGFLGWVRRMRASR